MLSCSDPAFQATSSPRAKAQSVAGFSPGPQATLYKLDLAASVLCGVEGKHAPSRALARWSRSAHSQAQGLDAGFVSWHLAGEWPLSALYVCFLTMVFSLGPLEEFRELTPHPNFLWAGAQTGPRNTETAQHRVRKGEKGGTWPRGFNSSFALL